MYGKQLELLKEIVPGLSRVAVLGTSSEPGYAQALRETERAAQALRVQLQYLDVLGPKDLETAFRAARTGARTRFSHLKESYARAA
jgi:putative tryptophan/tyrosine transport system substrate-binding protein